MSTVATKETEGANTTAALDHIDATVEITQKIRATLLEKVLAKLEAADPNSISAAELTAIVKVLTGSEVSMNHIRTVLAKETAAQEEAEKKAKELSGLDNDLSEIDLDAIEGLHRQSDGSLVSSSNDSSYSDPEFLMN